MGCINKCFEILTDLLKWNVYIANIIKALLQINSKRGYIVLYLQSFHRAGLVGVFVQGTTKMAWTRLSKIQYFNAATCHPISLSFYDQPQNWNNLKTEFCTHIFSRRHQPPFSPATSAEQTGIVNERKNKACTSLRKTTVALKVGPYSAPGVIHLGFKINFQWSQFQHEIVHQKNKIK